MRLVNVDIDEISKDLPEIKSSKFDSGGKIFKDGIFSLQIFGPLSSYKCACPRSIYRGPNSNEKVCKVCDVEISTSDSRRKRFGKIKLPFQVLNPMFYYLVTNARSNSKTVIDDLLNYKNRYFINKETKCVEVYTPESNLKVEVLEGLSGVLKYFDFLCELFPEKDEFIFLQKNKKYMTLNNILVIPPELRSYSKSSSGVLLMDKLNQHYKELLTRIEKYNKISYEISEDHDVYKTYFKSVQYFVNVIFNYILDRLSTKKGLIRKNILGKRLDFSGRAVISPDPTLRLNQCRIPYLILLEMIKPQLTVYLVNRKICKRYNQAAALLDKCIVDRDPQLFNIVEDFCVGKLCVINRQPTLHRLSIMGFYFKPTLGNTIQIHPLICSPLNADYDGDSIAVYYIGTDLSYKDVKDKVGVWNNLISPSDASIVCRPNQDIILGLYKLTE